MREDAGLYHQTAWASFAIQVIVDQRRQPALQSTVSPVGKRHGTRLAVHQFIPQGIAGIPIQELVDRHPSGDLANTAMGHLYQNFVVSRKRPDQVRL